MYEVLIRARLAKDLKEKDGLSERQYDFRQVRLTVHALQLVKNAVNNSAMWKVLITLDVKNAFNTASWGLILQRLEKLLISQYIRTIIAEYLIGNRADSGIYYTTKCCVCQWKGTRY